MLNEIDKWLVIPLLLSLSACGTGTLLNNRFSIDKTPPDSLVLDASKRVILVTDKSEAAKPAQAGTNLGNGGKPTEKGQVIKQAEPATGGSGQERPSAKIRQVVCAEPSPDVFETLAASGNLNLASNDSAKLQLAQTMAALSRRTATTQLLRDALYRACEAYMNGAITHDEYRGIVMGYDEALITLVALESLAGPASEPVSPKEPPATNGTRARGKMADNGTDGKTAITNTSPVDDQTGTQEGSKGVTAPENTDASGARKDSTLKPAQPTKAQVDGIVQIVKNYYCFQLTLKKLFYQDSPRRPGFVKFIRDDGKCDKAWCYGTIDEKALGALCGFSGQARGAAASGQREQPSLK